MVSVGDVVVFLKGDLTGLEAALKRSERSLMQTGSRIQGIGASLTAGLTLPLAAIGIGAAKASADFETAVVKLAKTVEAPREVIEALAADFVALSEVIPVSAGNLAELGGVAGQLGIKVENLREFVETAAALGVTTNLSAEEAANALARLANITQLPQTEIAKLGSVVVELGNNLATTEAEIVEMSLRLAGAGTQIGLTEAQILGFSGALSSVGIRAEAGGSAFSRVFIEIASAVESSSELLDDFAATAGQSTQEFARFFERDAAGALVAFIEGLGNLESQGKSTFGVIEALGLADVRVRDALLRASNAGDLLRRSLELGTAEWEENTALTNEAAQFYDRLAGRFATLGNKVGNVAAELGNVLRPEIDAVISGGKRLLDIGRSLVGWFGSWSDETRRTVIVMLSMAAALGPVLFGVGALIKVGGALTGIMAGILGPVALVVVALGAITAASITVYQNWGYLVTQTRLAFAAVANIVLSSVAATLEGLQGFLDRVAEISTAMSTIPGATGTAAKATAVAASAASDAISGWSGEVDALNQRILADTGRAAAEYESAIYEKFIKPTEAAEAAAAAAVLASPDVEPPPAATGPVFTEEQREAIAEFNKALSEIPQLAALMGESFEPAKAELALLETALASFVQAELASADVIGANGETVRDYALRYQELTAEILAAAEAKKLDNALTAEAESILMRLATPADRYALILERLNFLRQEGFLTEQQHSGAMRAAKEQFEQTGDILGPEIERQGMQLGQQFFKGMIDGSFNMSDALKSAITAIVQKAMIAVVAKLLLIASPSGVGINLGRQYGLGLALGVEQSERDVAMAAARLTQGLLGPSGAGDLVGSRAIGDRLALPAFATKATGTGMAEAFAAAAAAMEPTDPILAARRPELLEFFGEVWHNLEDAGVRTLTES